MAKATDKFTPMRFVQQLSGRLGAGAPLCARNEQHCLYLVAPAGLLGCFQAHSSSSCLPIEDTKIARNETTEARLV